MSERVLIVDDHPLTRDALSSLLGAGGFDVVGEAEDGVAAIELAQSLQPDLVLLDLTMPELDGLTALPRLREAAPGCEVVVLTASGTEDNLLCGDPRRRCRLPAQERAAGADRRLPARRRERRSRPLGRDRPPSARPGLRTSGRLGGGVPDRIAQTLSAREVEVLLLLDDHLATDEIAKRLFISEHTVRSHVKSLLRKLGVSSRRDALEQLNIARG